MSEYTDYLRSLVRGQQDRKVRATWRILIPVFVGFVALQAARHRDEFRLCMAGVTSAGEAKA